MQWPFSSPLRGLGKTIDEAAAERQARIIETITKQRERMINVPALAGGDFEDVVQQLLEDLALDHVVRRTSRTPGVAGDAGDLCVDTPEGITVVVECKRGYEAGMSQPKMVAELEKAKANRQAVAGVLVLDNPRPLGGRRLSRLSAVDYATVVTADETEDGLGLYCALLLAKVNAAVRRSPASAIAEVAQHAEALETAVRKHDELLTLLNKMKDDAGRGVLLVQDSRHAVHDAASRLSTFVQSSAAGPLAQGAD
jgi:hypothetical protein